MQITEISKDQLKQEFRITIDLVEISKYYDKEVDKICKNAKIPGFRPGKVSVAFVKQNYDAQIKSTILKDIINDKTIKFFEDKSLIPVEEPKIDIESFDENTGLNYKIAFESFPEVIIPKYDDITINKYVSMIGEEYVEKTLSQMKLDNKEYIKKDDDKQAQENDAVIINYQGIIDDVPFDGGTGENHRLILGSNSFIAGFEEQLIGAKSGDDIIVDVTFPSDYHVENLKGKNAKFNVKIIEILVAKEEFDEDEFAVKFGCKDISDLKQSIKLKLQIDIDEIARNKTKKELFDILDEKCDFPIPSSLVEKELKSISESISKSKEQENVMDVDFQEEYKSIAERRVRLGILIAEIAKIDGVKVDQKDLKEAMMNQARQFPGQENVVIDYYRNNPKALDALKGPIIENKTVDYMIAKIKLNEQQISVEELLNYMKS